MKNLNIVIMSGGCGSRLWPMSRATYPKQFLPLCGDESLLQETVSRVKNINKPGDLIVVGNKDHRYLIAEQLRQINVESPKIILEPSARNTAPAIALAALEVQASDPEALLLVLASDHKIQDDNKFCETVEAARQSAEEGAIITFGITPTHPATGYGYIRCEETDNTIKTVDCFVEKPCLSKAEEYLNMPTYFWNSGMFLARADVLLSELCKFRPAMHQNVCDSYELKHVEGSFIAPDTAAFENCPSESIDYAIMEQSKRIKMLALNTAWSDVGTWKELAKISETDEDGNSCIGDVLLQNSQNNYIRSNKKLCATVGVKDLIIVNNDDALLIAHKDESENVKQIVTQLEALKRPEARTHQTVNRPWGSYCNIDQGFGFKVKHITVKPGAKLSLQKHFHRAEHWVIVKGSALVTNGEENILLSENQSTYIPIGTLHRLENPGKIPLELIEVQSGNYLEEDDIVRYDDDYGRSNQSIPLKVNKDQKKGVS